MSKSCDAILFVHTLVNNYDVTLNENHGHTVGSHGTRLGRVAVFADDPDGVEQSWSSVLPVGVSEARRRDQVKYICDKLGLNKAQCRHVRNICNLKRFEYLDC